MTEQHVPVMLDEVLKALNLRDGGVYVDCTFGRGGHSAEMLARIGDGKLFAIDKDPTAIAAAAEKFGEESRFKIHHGSFAELEAFLRSEAVFGKVDGILIDLGVSSPQLDEAERGFSFMKDGPLDMRMNTAAGETAAEYLAKASAAEIGLVLKELGEEKWHHRIAQFIVERRAEQPLETTMDLVRIVEAAVPRGAREKHKNAATRTFLALRLHINRELDDLRDVLGQCVEGLAAGGRLVVIGFHSLEDRIVKRYLREQANPPQLGRPDLPMLADAPQPTVKLVGKAAKATGDELERNVRSRSAVLRVAEKLEVSA